MTTTSKDFVLTVLFDAFIFLYLLFHVLKTLLHLCYETLSQISGPDKEGVYHFHIYIIVLYSCEPCQNETTRHFISYYGNILKIDL